jgi:hypothetical protein
MSNDNDNNQKVVFASILAVIVATGLLAVNLSSITDTQPVLSGAFYDCAYTYGYKYDISTYADNDGPKYICPKNSK